MAKDRFNHDQQILSQANILDNLDVDIRVARAVNLLFHVLNGFPHERGDGPQRIIIFLDLLSEKYKQLHH